MTLIMLCISINVKAAYSGTCGDNLRWSFSNGILSISGNGRMTDWDISEDVPWYSNRSNIRQVIINNSVTSIGAFAFFDCPKLASVIIPNSVTNIGTAAFSLCTDLTSITIPNSVTNIGNSAFSTCKGLTSLTIPNSVTSIGEAAFMDCTNLTSITIPNSVTSIGGRAFSSCKGLASITIPNSVTSIGENAFQHCSSLTSVTIPNSVTSMGHGVFSGCYSITSIKVESGNSNYDSRENCNAIIETTTNTLISGCQKTIIPNSVTSIGKEAFLFCSTLTSITIPNSVTSIGEHAFYGCTGLTSVTIPYSVTSIANGAFERCSRLTSITIPYSVTSIGNNAFFNCSGLTSVTIPNTMTSIGQYAFLGCDGLTSVICEALNPPTIFFETFMSSTYTNASLKVYESSLNAYKQDNYWKNFTKIEAMSSPIFVSNITLSATSASLKVGETKTLTATISPTDASYKNVKWTSSNENVATVSASGVVTAKVVGSTTITATATDGSDKKATCSVTVTNIIANGTCGDNLTWELSIDGTLTISGSGRMTDWNSFTAVPWNSNSSQINKVIIGNSVTSIGSCAFYGCSKLTSVTIPYSVTSIGGFAFYVCKGLTSIEIPNSVTSIEIGVFQYCM